MRAALVALLLTSCAAPKPVPDVFSPAAHQGFAEPYRSIESDVLWRYSYQPPDDIKVMRYFVPPDTSGSIPQLESPSQPEPETNSSEGPWRP